MLAFLNGWARRQIGRDRDNISFPKMRDDGLHRFGRRAMARAVLKFKQLPRVVKRRTPRDCRHIAGAQEIGTMARCARDSLASAAPHQRSTARHAACGTIGDKGRARRMIGLHQIGAQLDNTYAKRHVAAAWNGSGNFPCGHEEFGRRIGFLHFDPRGGFK